MKKMFSLFLTLVLVFFCFAFHSLEASALGAVWVKEFYKDKFGDTTDEYYLTNKSQFKGTFNSDSVSDGELGANLIFERDGGFLRAYATLFFNGKDQLKNGASSSVYYAISVKRADGSVFDTAGSMVAGESRIQIDASIELARALRAYNGVVKIYIEDSYYANNNYLFTVECGNFDDLYNQEIFVPYQEEKYQEAEHLLEEKKYDEAAEAFRALGEYKDSPTRVEELLKTADAYAAADGLLKEKKYDEAAEAFRALGDYKDSKTHAEEAMRKVAEYEHLKELYKAGSIITFGRYEQDNNIDNGKEPIEWIVLLNEGYRSLLISRYAIDVVPFDNNYKNNWESSSLRGFLNGKFLNTAFNPPELEKIQSSIINNDIIPGEITFSSETEDKVFLLSYSEVGEFFVNTENRKCELTDYARSKAPIAGKNNECSWWLRTPAYNTIYGKMRIVDYNAMTVGMGGAVNKEGTGVNNISCGVRPALWIENGL